MATIKIDNLKPAGAELFDDSEGFMDKLSNDEFGSIYGGLADSGCHTNSGTCSCVGQAAFELAPERTQEFIRNF
jgi:hypothetical protein